MSIVSRLLHTRYRVNDVERMVNFLVKVLGLEVTTRHQSPRGAQLVFLKAPASEELIELCQLPDSPPVQVQPDLTHLAFQVADLDQFQNHISQLGIAFSDGPHTTNSGNRIAFIDAPEGYEIELIQMPGK